MTHVPFHVVTFSLQVHQTLLHLRVLPIVSVCMYVHVCLCTTTIHSVQVLGMSILVVGVAVEWTIMVSYNWK